MVLCAWDLIIGPKKKIKEKERRAKGEFSSTNHRTCQSYHRFISSSVVLSTVRTIIIESNSRTSGTFPLGLRGENTAKIFLS